MNGVRLTMRKRASCLEQTDDPPASVVLLECGPRFLDFYEQHCPIEGLVMMEVSHICVIQ